MIFAAASDVQRWEKVKANVQVYYNQNAGFVKGMLEVEIAARRAIIWVKTRRRRQCLK
jgi:hypothetical protein